MKIRASFETGKTAVRIAALSVFCLAVVAGAGYSASKKQKADMAAPVMENTNSSWMTAWPDGTPTGADYSSLEGVSIVKGNSRKVSYGSVYKKVDVDLDKTPYLVADINSTNAFWYIVIKNGNIKQGYVKVQSDTSMIGKQVYDIRTVTGLKGKQNIEIEFGVSSGKDEPNFGKMASFADVKFVPQESGAIGAIRVSAWKDKWPDGSSSGASVKEDSGKFIVSGISNKQSYGTVYRIITVNLDKNSTLKINPLSVNGQWYLEASGGSLKAPVKIQGDTDAASPQFYDLKEILGISGEQSFELHIGVGSGSQEPNAGKEAVFSSDFGFFPATAKGQ